jgi:hypothetical protein
VITASRHVQMARVNTTREQAGRLIGAMRRHARLGSGPKLQRAIVLAPSCGIGHFSERHMSTAARTVGRGLPGAVPRSRVRAARQDGAACAAQPAPH